MKQKKMSASLRPVTPVRPRRFDIHSETTDFLEYLDTHGYAVVASVAGQSEIEHAKDLLWNFLEGSDRINPYNARRSDPSTWYGKDGWLGNDSTGIISGAGVGQAPFMWYLRLLPDVSRAFASIWNVSKDELLCSFDGANVFRPWQYDSNWKTRGGWYHVDQNAYNLGKSDRSCVQGLVTLERCDEHTGGLVVLPGSHKHFAGVCERNAQKPIMERGENLLDFVRIRRNDDEILRGVNPSLICAEPGDLILWDSRTVHCNTPALINSSLLARCKKSDSGSHSNSADGWNLIRMVAYVCMTPVSWANDNVLHRRVNAYVNNTTTNHWPHEFSGGNRGPFDMPKNSLSSISDRQRRLIGDCDLPLDLANSITKEYTKEQYEARRVLELAEAAEGNGDQAKAIRLYKRAYKLDPILEFPDS
mmetsp:Transcript_24768/g.49273  ORF Transcript_24768/g.49273 Transcript_24768/m.49273 type:complete len:418 (-) Transcript_24768:48-1301(-)